MNAGVTQGGLDGLSRAISHFQATGAAITIPYFEAIRAKGMCRMGQASDALTLINEVLARIEDGGERWFDSFAMKIKADIQANPALNDHDGAEQSYLSAIAKASRQNAGYFEVQARLAFAQMLESNGNKEQAHQVLSATLANRDVLAHLTGHSLPEDALSAFV